MRDDLLKLKNIGEKTVDWLIDVGIESRADIEELGAVGAYNLLREKYTVTRNALWALQGALLNISYTQIPEDIKQSLLDELGE